MLHCLIYFVLYVVLERFSGIFVKLCTVSILFYGEATFPVSESAAFVS